MAKKRLSDKKQFETMSAELAELMQKYIALSTQNAELKQEIAELKWSSAPVVASTLGLPRPVDDTVMQSSTALLMAQSQV